MARTRLLISLCGLVFFLNLARIVFAPLVDVFIAEFAIGEATAGLIVTLVWIGSASLRLPTGWLLTKVSRHRVILLSGIILTSSSALTASATTVEHLMIGGFAMGVASGVYFVSANPLLSELYPSQVGRVMGIHGASSQAAAVLAAPLVALTLLVDWRLSLWTIAIGATIVTLYTWLAAKQTELPRAGTEDRDFVAAALSEWRIVFTGLALVGVAVFVWQGVFNFYELYMQSKGLSSWWAGAMLTLLFASGIPAFIFGGAFADRLPYVWYILGIVGAFALTLFSLTLVDGLVPIIVLTGLLGFVIHALYPATDTYLLETLPDSTRGSAYAVFSTLLMITHSLGSYALGIFLESGYTYDQVFLTASCLIIITIVPFALLERRGALPR